MSNRARLISGVMLTAVVIVALYVMNEHGPEVRSDGRALTMSSSRSTWRQGLDAPAGDGEASEHSPSMEACRELQRTGIAAGCRSTGGYKGIVDGVRLLDESGSVEGSVAHENGSTSIDEIVSDMILLGNGERPCEVIGSPGSRLIATLGPNMSCELTSRIRAALDQQNKVTMLACLELASEGIAPGCISGVGVLGGVGGEITRFVKAGTDEESEGQGGLVLIGGTDSLESSLAIMRRNSAERPCGVVGPTRSRIIAVLSPEMSCDQASHIRAVVDRWVAHDQ
jgi:hypothetical protein